jgi:hypothetical protein
MKVIPPAVTYFDTTKTTPNLLLFSLFYFLFKQMLNTFLLFKIFGEILQPPTWDHSRPKAQNADDDDDDDRYVH